MQESEFNNANNEAEISSELKIEAVATGVGQVEHQVIVPPRAIVKVPGTPTVEVVDQRRYADLSSVERSPSGHQHSPGSGNDSPSVSFSLAFARENGVSDAVIHRQLQQVQRKTPSFYARRGKQYIPGYNGQWIFDALPCFEHRSIVYDTASRLARNKHLEPEDPEDLYNKAWYKYPLSRSFYVPAPLSNDDLLTIRAFDARRFGMINTVLLAAYRARPVAKIEQGVGYKRMSAEELALELPYNPQTIGKYLRQFIGNEILVAHPKYPKYLRYTLD